MGTYQAIDPERVKSLSPAAQETFHQLTGTASQKALATTAIFPAVMLLGYLGLFIVFRTRGGYRAVALSE
jgi:hypothetical protein